MFKNEKNRRDISVCTLLVIYRDHLIFIHVWIKATDSKNFEVYIYEHNI